MVEGLLGGAAGRRCELERGDHPQWGKPTLRPREWMKYYTLAGVNLSALPRNGEVLHYN